MKNQIELDKLLLSLLNGQRRGRKPVEIGEARDVLVQENNGDVFIRVPAHTLGVKKGDRLTALFQDKQIVIVKSQTSTSG